MSQDHARGTPRAPLAALLSTSEKAIILGSLILVAALAWAYTLAGSSDAGHHAGMRMEWTLAHAAAMFVMWWIMMIAMMLPSASPIILLFAAFRQTGPARSSAAGSTAFFAGGYLIAWGGFSLLAVALQWTFESTGLLSGSLRLTSGFWTAALLIAAGLYQFSSLKRACLAQCRSPATTLARIWRPGRLGALTMGIHHGLFCVGCCWFMMLLLFFGGVMSPYWIIGLALYVAVEKLAPIGSMFGKAVGGVLIASGAASLLLTAA